GILAGALLPVAFSIASEQKLAQIHYQRAIAMEIVDGEMETLAAGDWRGFTAGVHDYPVNAAAATNLPPGKFLLTVSPQSIRLEWRPEAGKHGPVAREVAR